MIELIIAFGIGAALGGVTLFCGYKFGYSRGHQSGYKLANDTANSARSVLGDMLPLAMLSDKFTRPAPPPADPSQKNIS